MLVQVRDLNQHFQVRDLNQHFQVRIRNIALKGKINLNKVSYKRGIVYLLSIWEIYIVRSKWNPLAAGNLECLNMMESYRQWNLNRKNYFFV
jgi:hypothetical protein